jgi:hypothetical protein
MGPAAEETGRGQACRRTVLVVSFEFRFLERPGCKLGESGVRIRAKLLLRGDQHVLGQLSAAMFLRPTRIAVKLA